MSPWSLVSSYKMLVATYRTTWFITQKTTTQLFAAVKTKRLIYLHIYVEKLCLVCWLKVKDNLSFTGTDYYKIIRLCMVFQDMIPFSLMYRYQCIILKVEEARGSYETLDIYQNICHHILEDNNCNIHHHENLRKQSSKFILYIFQLCQHMKNACIQQQVLIPLITLSTCLEQWGTALSTHIIHCKALSQTIQLLHVHHSSRIINSCPHAVTELCCNKPWTISVHKFSSTLEFIVPYQYYSNQLLFLSVFKYSRPQ